MACELKSEIIGGEKWTCMQMPATQALDLESRIFPAILPFLSTIFASLGEKADVQIPAINQAFSTISKMIPPAEFVRLIRELCDQAMCNGQRVDFEQAFSGGAGVSLRYRIAWFVLKANYADFLGGLLPAGAKDLALREVLKRIVKEGFDPESTGGSGAPSSPNPPFVA